MRAWMIGFGAALLASAASAQAVDPASLRPTAEALRDRALGGSGAYPLLESLTTEIGPRPAGSPAEHRAALWAVAHLKALGFENVHVESFPLTAWTRGVETAEVVSPFPQKLSLTALGGSVATPPGGIEAEVALFHTYEDFLAAPVGSLAGKIAVVTQPMAATQDGSGYGAMYRVRGEGAREAAKRGAVAYLLRSLATDDRRAPHTGTMSYTPAFAEAAQPGSSPGNKPPPRIPAAALSVPDAEQLDRIVARGGPLRLHLTLTPTFREGATSQTVVGELRGRERPGEVVLIGGHLDSWDLGTGAIDDGAGVAITAAAAKLIADLPQRPRRTIRLALFGAEEVGKSNAAYAAAHPGPEHVIASECDFGAERVVAVELPANVSVSPWGRTLATVLAPLRTFVKAEPATDGGADLEDLKGVPLAALAQDGTHYFDLHHTADDTLDKVDRHRMDEAVAAWAAFTWMAAESDVDFRALAAAPAVAPGRG